MISKVTYNLNHSVILRHKTKLNGLQKILKISELLMRPELAICLVQKYFYTVLYMSLNSSS